MKRVVKGLAAPAVTAILTAAPVYDAKADGGAVTVGVGAYLVADYVVGRKSCNNRWPFNIIKKVFHRDHCRPACAKHRYRRRYC